MIRSLAIASLLCAASAICPMRAAAESTTPMPPMPMPPMHAMAMRMPQQISVAASGTAEYVPDTARITLGIRAESASAATAIDTINKNAAQVIAAVKGLGISESAVKTIGYNLQYRERPVMGQAQTASVGQADAAGNYEASEMLQVSAPVAVAGKVLDAAISAGANESFGLSYQTSRYDSLYRAALASAVKSARDSAEALAKAAHVTIVQIQSISNSSEPQVPGFSTMRAPMAMNSAPVMPGTDAVTATVYVVYSIK
jgi:uncharacterized protein